MSWEPVDWPTVDLLADRVETIPDRTALVDADRDEQWTYRRLHVRVERRAGVLSDRGVEPGDAVGLLMKTGVSFVELVHAAMRLRATLVPLNVALPAEVLASQVERAALDWLVCASETEATAVELLDPERVFAVRRPTSESVHIPDRPSRDAIRTLDRPTNRLADSDPIDRDHVDHVPVDRDWTELIQFTSGTTGEPKGVRLTAGNLVASASASASRLGVDPSDRWLVCLPTYHVGGLAPVIRSTLYGTTVVLQRAFDAEGTPRAMGEYEITGVSLVPTMLVRMLDAGWTPPGHLRFVLLGGAPASAELIDRCEARGVPVFPTYGSTETASQIATATPAEAFEHEGTVGKPLERTEVTVVDEAGDPVGPGTIGELVVDGPTVTPGYLDDEQTAAAFGPHGLQTGDVGYRDEGGRLWVVGRTDDTIVTGGEKVHPARVADAIREHPAVEAVAVVGIPDPEWGERVGALVVGGVDRKALDVDGLSDHCRERLAGFEVPKTWGFADELPRTASGTVDREVVRERLDGD